MDMSKWINLTDMIEAPFFDKCHTGQLLRFEKADIKIMRKASNGKVWGQVVFTYSPEEVDIVDKA